jgi:hypothetical protein
MLFRLRLSDSLRGFVPNDMEVCPTLVRLSRVRFG